MNDVGRNTICSDDLTCLPHHPIPFSARLDRALVLSPYVGLAASPVPVPAALAAIKLISIIEVIINSPVRALDLAAVAAVDTVSGLR